MSSWRDVQEAGSAAVRGWLRRVEGQVSVMGADETVVKVRGDRTVVGFVADAGTGRLVGIDILLDRDSDGFVEWLKGYVSGLGVEVIVSDDLSTYKPVVERLGVEHQVCPAYVRKNVWVRLDGIKGWDGYKARIWGMLGELPESGGRELLGMERYVRGGLIPFDSNYAMNVSGKLCIAIPAKARSHRDCPTQTRRRYCELV